ncbi:MAG: LapA family protein [Caldimonas sp.]
MGVLVWIVRAVVFFTLFAFALNNQDPSSVHLFFGQEWRAPMVFIVLAAFGLGCAFGIFAMVPSWWRHRRIARREIARAPVTATAPAPLSGTEPMPMHPPRDGL